jgi:hypothetical protein
MRLLHFGTCPKATIKICPIQQQYILDEDLQKSTLKLLLRELVKVHRLYSRP